MTKEYIWSKYRLIMLSNQKMVFSIAQIALPGKSVSTFRGGSFILSLKSRDLTTFPAEEIFSSLPTDAFHLEKHCVFKLHDLKIPLLYLTYN